MGESDTSTSTITFELLYNLVRTEKTNNELQELKPEIYVQIVNYLKNKIEIYRDSKLKRINAQDLDKIKIQINSARKLIKEFYERRERKVIELAINKSRTKKAEETKLLEYERGIYEEFTKILDHNRESILLNLVNAKLPDFAKDIKLTKSDNINNDSKTDVDAPKTVQTGSIETEQIIFVKDVPKFLGKNREVYGPFKPGDIAMLDKDITKILINKKHAKLILN
jgi:DNA replication initiation complex subunit (GINS family)